MGAVLIESVTEGDKAVTAGAEVRVVNSPPIGRVSVELAAVAADEADAALVMIMKRNLEGRRVGTYAELACARLLFVSTRTLSTTWKTPFSTRTSERTI